MALGWLGILKCLVLVLPLVSFIPEGADAAETLVRQEAGLEQLAAAGSDCPDHCRLCCARVIRTTCLGTNAGPLSSNPNRSLCLDRW